MSTIEPYSGQGKRLGAASFAAYLVRAEIPQLQLLATWLLASIQIAARTVVESNVHLQASPTQLST
jgi:hypothetical protein